MNTQSDIIANGNDWDDLWNKIITYYWTNYKTPSDRIDNLVDIIDNIKFKNTAKVQGTNTIYFIKNKVNSDEEFDIPKNKLFDSLPVLLEALDKKNKEIQFELRANFHPSFDKGKLEGKINIETPKYENALAYLPINGWRDVRGRIRLKVPMYLEFQNISSKIPIRSIFKKTSLLEDTINEFKSNQRSNIEEEKQEMLKLSLNYFNNLCNVCFNILSQYTLLDAAMPLESMSNNVNNNITSVKEFIFDELSNKYERYNDFVNEFFDISDDSDQTHAEPDDFELPGDYLDSGLSQKFDRGGAKGYTDHIAYVNFVPRMISYLWNHNLKWKKKVNNDGEEIVLNRQVELEIKLGYTIPAGLEVLVESVIQKINLDSKNATESVQVAQNNLFSTVEVNIPGPPHNSAIQPIALSDFLALRSNMPFTTL
ncbi:hypothetical protein SAMN04489761_0928 [Tenacibaculum sp. MAR_2009_124]|uniref:hypothetical protein n=1 Tax=Tenacibaculum sp. MAR_2009_124 TaxID=1250059 RepID=UPI000895027D|nr:hypothetical protein [Tenacibaculum sp. MAR_2009_124]SEB47444.1 hypothetical protein SAMN04489761_0928 [Tenacibaculum sp. MAR_2009_124]